jgi:cob(I)alamin adenosyltransferase
MYQSLAKIHLQPRQSQKLLLQIAETLFDIGTDLLQKKSLDGAVKYLRWSWDYMVQLIRVEGLTVDGGELSVNIRHNLAKALIRRNAGDELDLDRARELVNGLALVYEQ